MKIKSFSKINLTLTVLKKLSSGLHDIQSNVCLIDLHDKIAVKETKNSKDIVIFTGKHSKYIQSKNSITDTLNLLRKHKIIKKKFEVKVHKNIPVFSGLGGGTSNSAFLIKYFLKKKPSQRLLSIFEKKIGTDLRLFFQKQSLQKNLKKVIEYSNRFKFFFLIVYPNVICSTKYIYSNVLEYKLTNKIKYLNTASENKFLELIIKDNNDLQQIVIKKYPYIKDIINYIKIQEDCQLSRITGSGSACFGLFKSQKTAKLALNRFKLKYPRYWCVTAKTI